MKVSVIIPCYNTEKYIEDCITSVCKQTLKDIEIIFINDGSTDNSLKIVQELAKKDKRIKIINQENKGVAYSRNIGIKNSKGKYLYFLDSDDMIASDDVLEYCYNIAEKNKLEIITGSGKAFYQNEMLESLFPEFKLRYQVKTETDTPINGIEAIKFLRETKSYYVLQGCRMFNRNFILKNKIKFDEGQIHEDVTYTFNSLYLAKRVMVVKKQILFRRLRDDSIMTKPLSTANLFGYINAFIETVRNIENHKEEFPIDDKIGYTIIGMKTEFMKIYESLDQKEINKFIASANKEQLYYFRTFIKNELDQKSQIALLKQQINNGSEQNRILINNIFKYATNHISAQDRVNNYDYSQYKNPVNIVLISDNNFFIPLCTTIQSLRNSKKNDSFYRIYVINSDFDERNKKILKMLQTESFEIIIKDFSIDKYKEFEQSINKTLSKVSTSALIKFDLSDIINEDKILYIDSDIIVKQDLSEMYNTNIADYYAGVVKESGTMYTNKDKALYNPDEYFNSGVLLLNLKQLRNDDIPQKLLKIKQELKDVSLMDQNVFNIVFNGKVKFLPIIYNFLTSNLERSKHLWTMKQLNAKYNSNYTSIEDIENKAVIVHYASKDKPWTNTTIHLYDLWYETFSELCEKLNKIN